MDMFDEFIDTGNIGNVDIDDLDFLNDFTPLDLSVNHNTQDTSSSIIMDLTMPVQMGEDVITEVEVVDLTDDSYSPTLNQNPSLEDIDRIQPIANLFHNGLKHKSSPLQPSLVRPKIPKLENVMAVPSSSNDIKSCNHTVTSGDLACNQNVTVTTFDNKTNGQDEESQDSTDSVIEFGSKSCNRTVTSGDLACNQNVTVTAFDNKTNGQDEESQDSTDSIIESVMPNMTKLENVILMPPSTNINTNCNHTVTTGALSSHNQSLPTTSFDQRIGQDRPNAYQNLNTKTSIDWTVASNLTVHKEPQMYYQLLDLFPEIDRNYLSDLCKTGFDITDVTEIILETNNNYPKRIETSKAFSYRNSPLDVKPVHLNIPSSGGVCDNNILENICTITSVDSLNITTETKSIEQNDEVLKINTQLEFLIQIFPKADPDFLKEKCTLKDEELRDFIAKAMEKHDYPKIIDQTVTTVTEQEDIGLYTTAFNLNNFLKIFPDPFVYFMDEKRICQYSSHAVEFMKRRYKYQSIKNIHKNYKDFGYNLPRTCEFLEYAKNSRATKRTQVDIHMPETVNLPFLQEMCFVEHKEEIKAHLDGIAEAKKLAYEQAEARGELIECGCCYSSVLFEDCAACNEGDLFCKSCILKGTEIRIGDGCTTFPCLLDCGSHFSLHLLQNLLEARVFSKLLQRIQLDEVKAAEIEGLEICPFCEFATIPPPETNIFTCLNPDCLKESCRKCHKVSHIPQRCEEVENDDQARARKYIEDEMTKALVRECYKCKKSFIKSDGCNKMTCTCGAKMCYICRQPITDYKHFNGPGGSENSKCPLYSTEKLLHVDAVKAVAEKALQDVAVNNPELKLVHDPSKVLPSAPDNRTMLPAGVQELPAMLLANLQRIHNEEPRPVRVVQVGPRIVQRPRDRNGWLYRGLRNPFQHLPRPQQLQAMDAQGFAPVDPDYRIVVRLPEHAYRGDPPRGRIEHNPPHYQYQ